MSKLNTDKLKDAVTDMLRFSNEEKVRKFPETVELQILLKGYDTQKDKRFASQVRLPHTAKPRMTVCVLGDAHDCDRAAELGLPFHDVEYLKSLKKNKKLVKKLAKRYDAFLASEPVLKALNRILGPGLSKAGKFPTQISRGEDMQEKINELRSTIKFQLKKSITLAVAIGNVSMEPQQLVDNTKLSVNFLVSLLKKNWQNVGSLHIKSTMGPSFNIY